MSAIVYAAGDSVVAVPGGGGAPGAQGAKGDPGGNVMAIGLFTALATMTIPVGTNVVRTSGYSVDGKGAADYVYDAAVDATYVSANPKTSSRDIAGRGFKLVAYQPLNWHMFGLAVDDNTGSPTDDHVAFNAMLAWQQARIQSGGAIVQYGPGAGPLIWCFGAAYLGPNTIVPDYACQLKGFTLGVPGASPTQLRWAAGTSGIILGQNSAGHLFEGFTLKGGFDRTSTGSAGDEGEFHAIQWHAPGVKRNLQGYNWQGDFLRDANTAGATGNTNDDVIEHFFGQEVRNLYQPNGADVNAKTITGLNAISCRQAGALERGFLGNFYLAAKTESNSFLPGWVNVGTSAARPACLVWSAGHVYACMGGQESWCSTNAPSGTTATNTGWIYHPGWVGTTESFANSQGVPTWVSGGHYRPGGGVIHQGDSNRSTFEIYSEANQLNQFDVNVGKITGNIDYAYTVNASSGTFGGLFLPPVQRGALHDYNMTIGGQIRVDGYVGTFGSAVSTSRWGVNDALWQFYASNLSTTIWFRSLGLGSDNLDAQIVGGINALNLSGKNAMRFQLNATTKWQLDGTGFYPADDNVQPIGGAGNRASVIYAGTGTINTSDKRHKEQIGPVDDAILDAWADVQWESFKFKAAVAAKKDGARLHVGLVAQHVADVFKKHEIDGFALGLLCYDKWDSAYEPEAPEEIGYVEREIVELPRRHLKSGKLAKRRFKTIEHQRVRLQHKLDDKNRPVMTLVRKSGDAFGVRYGEALALEAALQRRERARLEARIAALESRAAPGKA